MTKYIWRSLPLAGALTLAAVNLIAADAVPPIPSFSITYLDRSVKPDVDFYHYACGTWLKENPVPADKSRWAAFDLLSQRNWYLMRDLAENAEADQAAAAHSPTREVGDFYASVMDTNRINELGLKPLEADFARIAALKTTAELVRLVADFQLRGVAAMFDSGAGPDEKNSAIYALEFDQGGLGLPDRDYYLTEGFAKQRAAYVVHITKMLKLTGESDVEAATNAGTILALETELAKASKSRTDLRDPIANYHKLSIAELDGNYPALDFKGFRSASDIGDVSYVIMGQPEFFTALDKLVKERPLDDWKIYLKWHVLHTAARYLSSDFEDESFAFYGTVLSGQPAQEPRWQRAARILDGHIGEALGQLFVEKYYPPAAQARMEALISDLRSVLKDRLSKVPWMTEPTRQKALAKFARFTQKVGHPAKYRDYSSVEIRRDDLLGNAERAEAFESKRELARIGQPVDKTEWHMTPQTVNAYFSQTENEIVFPAGILQPPFFDASMDDAINYGAIGAVIGHEMTHGFDDQGRKYDVDGNLNDWWTPADATAFEARAQKLVDQYSAYEPLPGLHVNGRLTLGENIADLGGTTIGYEALQRALARDPSKRKLIDGLTPEQRFFLAFSQLWRVNIREAAMRRSITIDPHSPGQFRAIGPLVNMQEFFDAYDIKDGAPMWRAPEQRAVIW